MNSDQRCPLCGEQIVNTLGRIFHRQPVQVAGVALDLGERNFALVECGTCRLRIKFPQIPEARLLECYARASDSNWGEDPDPSHRHFDKVLRLAGQLTKGKRILDIGCFNGAMLQHFGTSWERFGVEPSHAAAKLAASRGITILGGTLDAANDIQEEFDVITAIDVIEHLITPQSFFAAIDRLLKPGGVLIIVTADSLTWPWRLEGSRYWYCSLPEHVCFWSRPSIQHLAKIFGWRLCAYQNMRHQVSYPLEIVSDLVRAVSFVMIHRVDGFGLPSLKRKLDRSAPTWITAPDHMLCALMKNGLPAR